MGPAEKPIDDALGRFVDGEPEPEDGPTLAKAMEADARFAEEMHRLLVIDGLLYQAADADAAAFAESIRTSLAAEDDGAQFTQGLADRLESVVPLAKRRSQWLPLMIALAVCIAVGAIAIWLTAEPTPQPIDPPGMVTGPAAILVNEASARFAADEAPTDGNFAPGSYQLEGGAVHLRFTSGAEVVMRSPARFTIIDRMNMALNEGSLRAVVPSSAAGFSVHASEVRYEDLGTEFGVSVGKPGESQLHVFEGRVDLKTPQGKLLSSVEVGESVRVTGNRVEPMKLEHPEQFPTAAMIGQEKWIQWRARLEKDPSLVCYYPFIQDAADRTLLKDHAPNDVRIDGRIAGARWVTGRWPEKQALLFDRDGDHVKVEIPGEFRQLTVSAWIYLDRCDFALNAIFNSDSWRAGALHFQMSRTGNCVIGHWAKKPQRKQLGPHVPVGRWTHVAAVADLDGLGTKTYINGEIAEKVKLASFPGALKPGSCRIGDWFRDKDPSSIPRHGFRGRIDELAVWRRAISQDEIRVMVAAGRASLASID
jgi:hypothetical protein